MIDVLIKEIIKKHSPDKLSKYLTSRCINSVDGLFWCDNVMHNNIIYNGMFSIVTNTRGYVSLIENRSLSGDYSKIYQDSNSVPLWGVNNIIQNNVIIVTESILDAESINDLKINDVWATSTFKSSFSLAQFHFLSFLTHNKKVILAFDNDDSGVNASNRYIDMSKNKYNNGTIQTLSFPYNDINAYKCKSSRFRKVINKTIRDIT